MGWFRGMGRGGSTAFTIPRSPDYESPGIVWIQGSVYEARLGLGGLPGTPWAASMNDERLRIIRIQGPVDPLGLEGLRPTFPKSTHNQGDEMHDSLKKKRATKAKLKRSKLEEKMAEFGRQGAALEMKARRVSADTRKEIEAAIKELQPRAGQVQKKNWIR